MATIYKVLGQALPSPNTFTTLYTVPLSTQAILSTLNVCNTSTDKGPGANLTFRVAVRPGGETIATKHYIVYDAIVPVQDSISLSLGMTTGNTDVVTVFSTLGNVVFSLFGTEIS